MKLFILLSCLAIDYYLHPGTILKRFAWLEWYVTKIQCLFPRDCVLFKGFLGIFMLVFPICALIGLPYAFMTYYQLALSGLGFHFFLLLYCFGPIDLHYQVNHYLKFMEQDDQKHATFFYKNLTEEPMDMAEEVNAKKVSKTILIEGNNSFFVIVFWYVVVGPLAVLVYRLIDRLACLAEKESESSLPFGERAIQLNQWLKWIPARLMALFYMLGGGLHKVSMWYQQAFLSNQSSEECLIACGMSALKLEKELPAIEENKKAMFLVNRALMRAMVIIAIFTLGSWIS